MRIGVGISDNERKSLKGESVVGVSVMVCVSVHQRETAQ